MSSPSFIAFDIETRGLPANVERYAQSFPDFDEDAVKCGNLKDPAKIGEKKAQARADHEAERETYWRNLRDRAALDPFTGAIVCIGVGDEHNAPSIIAEATEEATLRQFWHLWQMSEHAVTKFVFWSGCGDAAKKFDIDYIVTRSRINRVPLPAGVRQGRYYSPRIVDLAAEFLLHQRERFLSLTKACDMFGLYSENPDLVPKREDDLVTGANFAAWWDGSASNERSADEQRELARAYLFNDVRSLQRLTPHIL